MAVSRVQDSLSLQFIINTGVDGEGELILESKSMSNVKIGAAEQDIWDVVTALTELQEGTLHQVFIKEDYELVNE